MKNLRKNLIITIVMVIVSLIFMVKGVNAAGTTPQLNLGTGNGTTNQSGTSLLNPGTTNTAPMNTTTNTAVRNNVVRTNNINDASKDLPQTGENDIYIVTGIGVLAIAIGGFAYIKSKRFE